MPDDYHELINPLWSTQELRGRIERIERETADAVTVLIKPEWEWEGHRPGQYLRVSPYLVRQAKPGTIVRLGGVEGIFVLPRRASRATSVHQRR